MKQYSYKKGGRHYSEIKHGYKCSNCSFGIDTETGGCINCSQQCMHGIGGGRRWRSGTPKTFNSKGEVE